jgi:cytochrome c oxidase subunit II
MQSVLHSAGAQADAIGWLWWVELGICAFVFVTVLAILGVGIRRSRSPEAPDPVTERRLGVAVGGATGVTVLILFVLLGASIATGRATQRLDRRDALAITIVGNQWWWSIEYAFPQASERVRLANDLHLPRGRNTVITLQSNDVIHSFWVPNLHGKIDLIPGRSTEIVLRGDRAGRYRGQCAEYCGTQHAHMALTVTVDEPEAFDAWLNGQRQSSAVPATDAQQRGRMLIETSSCTLCHTIRGTSAGARTAPDLTHLGSRPTIAAGVLPNTADALERWLRDPQAVKPGNKMPNPGLSAEDRAALIAYLGSLK